jgi:F-type H+-transporting ATPase subunit epsilon/F-type H+-transporting ATPase subunit delta
LKDIDKSKIQDLIKLTEEEASKSEISDQAKFLADQKIQVLRSIN